MLGGSARSRCIIVQRDRDLMDNFWDGIARALDSEHCVFLTIYNVGMKLISRILNLLLYMVQEGR